MRNLVCLILASATLVGCHQQSKPKPTLNPHPKYYVRVTGNIDPRFNPKIQMGLWASYGGYNQKCLKWVNKFEGVKGMPGHVDYYPVKFDEQGNYSVKIPIDRYQLGKCQWKLTWIDYAYDIHPLPSKKRDVKVGIGDLIRFGLRGAPQELPGMPIPPKGTMLCKSSRQFKKDNCSGSMIGAGYTEFVPRDFSYHLVENIKKIGK